MSHLAQAPHETSVPVLTLTSVKPNIASKLFDSQQYAGTGRLMQNADVCAAGVRLRQVSQVFVYLFTHSYM